MDTIALIVGYAVLLCTSIIIIIALWFVIADKIAFRKYQKRGDKMTMDYARKTTKIEREKANTYDESNLFSDALWSDICKN